MASEKKLTLKEAIKSAKKVIAFGKPFHSYLYIALVAIFIQTFFELLAPVFFGKAIDCILGQGLVDFNGILINVLIG